MIQRSLLFFVKITENQKKQRNTLILRTTCIIIKTLNVDNRQNSIDETELNNMVYPENVKTSFIISLN